MANTDYQRFIERNADHILEIVGELKELSKGSEDTLRRLNNFERELRAQRKALDVVEGKARDVATWVRALKWVGGSVLAALLFIASLDGLVDIYRFFNP